MSVNKGNNESHARNLVCALAAIVYATRNIGLMVMLVREIEFHGKIIRGV